LPNYLRRFGLSQGLQLFLRIERELPTRSERVRRYAAPGYPPILLRDSVGDHAVFWQCLVQCHYDFFGFPQCQRLLRAYEGAVDAGVWPLIIDAGANIGLATVWFAQRFPRARVLAVEPDAENFRLLKMNTAAFGDRVTPVHGGIWHERAQLSIMNPESGSAAFRVSTASGAPTGIAAYTVDDLCSMVGVDAPLIVKLDIEGSQASLFSANTGWVERTHLVCLELDDWLMPWEGSSRSFFSCLSRHAFDYLLHGEAIFCFRDFAAGSPTAAKAHSGGEHRADLFTGKPAVRAACKPVGAHEMNERI
jgi:FkbM family methyltransferase